MRVGSIEQRDMMLELDPETYFITDHDRDWPGVLVRIAKIMLERRWHEIAPKRLLRDADGEIQPAKKKAVKTVAKTNAATAPARKPAPANAKAKNAVTAKPRARQPRV